MSNQSEILAKAGRRDGMTVPEGYFDDFTHRMEATLPDSAAIAGPLDEAPRSLWQRVRPYVYMAAMFAGVWCMLKMFTMFTATGPQPLDSNPIMAEAMGNDAFVNEYVIDDLSQWDIYDEMMDEGFEPCVFTDSTLTDILTD